ncbi:hypothetical protein Bca52824_088521 [Brassica carinata]|uniref:No apical meristem-associated C-terminal domain-containing protein n=1 Tax=Brassica carinata TaxID=52824 RepID=A0A8X7PDI3_BRACI|nr:hypothetical protein Bca52824_088521 [Brassica carinata]
MDFNPFEDSSNFVELLNSQQKVIFGNLSDTVSLSSSEVPKKAKNESSSKRRKCGDGSHSASSQVNENDEGTNHSIGVKVAKARGKRPVVEGKELSDFQSMWSLKKADLQLKERLSKMRMLESLVAKQSPLADYYEALKKKLIAELIPS